MSADTAAKRFSAMNIASPWRGLNVVPEAVMPSGERQAVMFLYSGIVAAPPATLAAITGTATAGITEADIVAGGKTILITLDNDTWVAVGAAFNAQRQAIINGLDSAQAEVFGWNTLVRDAELVTAVVRTSDTVVTITLSAAPTYNITATETITVTVPSSALVTSLVDVTGTPTFTVSALADAATSGGGGLDPGEGLRRRDLPAKPLGLPPKGRRKEAAKQAVDERTDAVREIHAEVKRESAERAIGEPAGTPAIAAKPIEAMSLSEIHAEIGLLLRIQQTKDDEDRLMLLLLAAGS